jgi:hypothetical protein
MGKIRVAQPDTAKLELLHDVELTCASAVEVLQGISPALDTHVVEQAALHKIIEDLRDLSYRVCVAKSTAAA